MRQSGGKAILASNDAAIAVGPYRENAFRR
jgi:hypothetical protein